jgi:hypothetical protein
VNRMIFALQIDIEKLERKVKGLSGEVLSIVDHQYDSREFQALIREILFLHSYLWQYKLMEKERQLETEKQQLNEAKRNAEADLL